MSAPERIGVVAARYLTHLRTRQETHMATTTVAITHEPITLVTGDVFCLEGECGCAAELDEKAADDAPCPLLSEVTVCGTCSTVTRNEWGPVVEWPCPAAATA